MTHALPKQIYRSLLAACYSVATNAKGAMMQFLRELLHSSTADGSRTNALNHLQWMLAAALAALVTSAGFDTPDFLKYLLGTILVVLLISYLVTHFYFMIKNPDALRSEKFTIEKMAIERGLVGDNESFRIIDKSKASNKAIAIEQNVSEQNGRAQ